MDLSLCKNAGITICFHPHPRLFYLFLRILFHYSPLLLSRNYSSLRLLPSPLLLDGKGVPQQPPHHVDAHSRAAHVGSAVAHLEKMGLHVVEAGVEDHLKIRRVWHFWYKLILVHPLRDIKSLLTEHLAQFLPPLQTFVLIGQVDHLHAHSPDLPGNVFRWEWPPCPPPLVELQ